MEQFRVTITQPSGSGSWNGGWMVHGHFSGPTQTLIFVKAVCLDTTP